MHCPDCDSSLVVIDITGVDKAYRCMMCGGVFLHGKGRDGLPDRSVSQWMSIRADPAVFKFGKRLCPADGKPLEPGTDKTVVNLNVLHCSGCKWWWFPTESLFLYDPSGYKTNSWEAMFRVTRTLILASMLIVGLVTGVNVVRTRQQTNIQAGQQIRNWSATYLGEGVVQVSFESPEKLFAVPFREMQGEWRYQAIEEQSQKYIFKIEGLKEGQAYEMRLGQKSYFFTAK